MGFGGELVDVRVELGAVDVDVAVEPDLPDEDEEEERRLRLKELEMVRTRRAPYEVADEEDDDARARRGGAAGRRGVDEREGWRFIELGSRWLCSASGCVWGRVASGR